MKKIDANGIIIQLITLELAEKENEIDTLKYQLGMLHGEKNTLFKKREHLIKDKQNLEKKLKNIPISDKAELLICVDDLSKISFLKHPIKKYFKYKKMLQIFHNIK